MEHPDTVVGGMHYRQPTIPDAEMSDEQRKHLEKLGLMQDEILTKQQQLDQMLIEDPAEFEHLIAQGDLEEEGTGNVDDAEAGRT